MVDVLVVRTGTANLASVFAGLHRAGAAPRLAATADEVRRASHVMLPGVGAFGAAMAELESSHLADALRARLHAEQPTFCICLGLQLLAGGSEESPGVGGLGIIDMVATRLSGEVRVPQLGWNAVSPDERCEYLQAGHAYFANSYCLKAAPPRWGSALSYHRHPFVAALERGPVVACQFHPELSGPWGVALLQRWLEGRPDTRRRPVQTADEGLKVRIIPCLDCRDGRVVKGVRFQGLRDAGDPAELAAAYEAQGADELVVLDVSATPEGRGTAVETVRRVRAALSIPLTVGGGVDTVEAAGRLLDAGADKVSVNTAAVRDPSLITEIATRFGSQCTVVAIDAAAKEESWEVVVLSGTERTGRSVVSWAREAVERGAGEILLTSWDRDGTRSGYDLGLLRAVSDAVSVPVIASGGAAGPEHLLEALQAGADAVLAASIFHEGQHTVTDVKRILADRGVQVRL